MKLVDVYTQLSALNQPVIRTQDASATLRIDIVHASKLLARLVRAKLLHHVGRGLWAFHTVDSLALPEYLTAPFPCYISLHTALYFHGMISQIPQVIYAVSIARTHLFKTPLAVISVHHLQPDFFFGYEVQAKTGIKMATAEKALIDFFYLSASKSKLFASLPEIELPPHFKIKTAREIIKKIPSARKKVFVERCLNSLRIP